MSIASPGNYQSDAYSLGPIVHAGPRSLLYLATRKSDGVKVIVKTTRDEYRASDADRIRNEFLIGSKLDVDGVMQPLGLWFYEGRPALVLEFFEGSTLQEVTRPMPVDRFLEVASRIAAILAGIHSKRVLHKDIKPDNILYSAATGEVKITDFGISTIGASQRPGHESAWVEGSLPYMSPEQTGRIDRAIDQRSDLYSLGISFYELLTGTHPFEAVDPLEWAHCHIARTPQPPKERVPAIPEIVSSLVLKLLAKDPEDRYQSAHGLRLDLDECLRQRRAGGVIQPFTLGKKDFPDGLRIPRRLYGREHETAALHESLQRVVAGGGPEFAMVSGYSGIGKSSLVDVLRQNSIAEQGMFVAGKFDQYHRDIPYATLVESFSGAVLQILAAGTDRIAEWKARLEKALGVNGRLMVEVIPVLESILGKQAPVPGLSPTEAKNRFRMVFRQFIGEFAQQDHPLVLFLDDMQWADSASLELIMDLACNGELRQLLLAGAYRDNEVGPSHPLTIGMEEAKKNGARIRNLVLSPLSESNLLALLTDTLRPAADDLPELARLLQKKTEGNPFYAIQFLLSLNEEGLIGLDGSGSWSWDIEAIRAKGFTENVIDLMSKRLHRLSPQAMETLQRFACLGAKAGSGDMARILGLGEDECHARLTEPMEAGLVLSSFETYAFLHDRVQEAAYSSIPENERPHWHLRIGRMLLENRSPQDVEEKVFMIVSQLNRGVKLIRDKRERENLIKLNSLAGRKAKASVAYDTARTCYSLAVGLLPEGAWQERYRECYSLHFELSECEFLLGNFDRAEELALLLLDKADSLGDRAAIYDLRMRCYQLSGKIEKALALSLEGLRLFGMDCPESDADIGAAIGKSMQEVQTLMRGRSIDSILDAPVAEDANVRAFITLLVGTIPCTFFVKPLLFPLVVLESVIQSLRHGNVEDSCIAYCCYGAIIQQDVDTGFRISEMSMRLNEKFGDAKRRSAVLYLHAGPHNYRRRPFTSSYPLFERGYLSGLETGDLLHASYNAFQHVVQAIEAGMAFDQVLVLIQRYMEFSRKSHNAMVEHTIAIDKQFIAALQGRTKGATSYEDGRFDENATLDFLTKSGLAPGVAAYHIRKETLAVIHGQFEESLAHSEKAKGVLLGVRCMPLETTYYYYRALALAGHFSHAPAEQQKDFRRELGEIFSWLENAAKYCPENFGCRHLLVSAEIARIEGREMDAMRLMEEAAESAEKNALTLDLALIQETASRFYRERKVERLANHHLVLARSAYRRLGAVGKVKLIDLHHPDLRKEKHVGRDTTSYEADTRQLDILSVAKASQAISGEILLDSLLKKMMRAMLEQAGAQWGCMLLRKLDKYELAADAALGEDGSIKVVLPGSDAGTDASAHPLPRTILDFVAMSRKRVILENAARDETFSNDPYIAGAKPKSVLCLPILRQGEASGLLYLENNLLAGAFTADKLEVLELMASQAAISLENAGLYEGLRREYSERKQVEEQLRHSQKMDALGTLAAGIAHDFNNLLNVINGYSEMALMRLDTGHPIFESLGEILKSGERAAGLTRQLLAYSRKQVLSPRLWNLNDIVREVETMLKRLIGESVAMTTRLGPEVGLVRADRGQVEQILMNLVVNARDAMPKGGQLGVETANVELGPDFCSKHAGMAPGPYVMLSVQDTGTGMTEEVKAKLFEPFFTTKEAGKGTGLGLAVVFGIVNQSGGGITVQSELGRGTTFNIYLPRALSVASEAEDPIGLGRQSTGGNETIMLVEDEESVRKFTSHALESQGFRVLVYSNGREALRVFDDPSVDVSLVISDIVMPSMGGKELAERIRQLRPKLPILFISGYADQPESRFPLRGETLLRKPFAVSELLGRVRELLLADS